jgi:hypothetical protein
MSISFSARGSVLIPYGLSASGSSTQELPEPAQIVHPH